MLPRRWRIIIGTFLVIAALYGVYRAALAYRHHASLNAMREAGIATSPAEYEEMYPPPDNQEETRRVVAKAFQLAKKRDLDVDTPSVFNSDSRNMTTTFGDVDWERQSHDYAEVFSLLYGASADSDFTCRWSQFNIGPNPYFVCTVVEALCHETIYQQRLGDQQAAATALSSAAWLVESFAHDNESHTLSAISSAQHVWCVTAIEAIPYGGFSQNELARILSNLKRRYAVSFVLRRQLAEFASREFHYLKTSEPTISGAFGLGPFMKELFEPYASQFVDAESFLTIRFAELVRDLNETIDTLEDDPHILHKLPEVARSDWYVFQLNFIEHMRVLAQVLCVMELHRIEKGGLTENDPNLRARLHKETGFEIDYRFLMTDGSKSWVISILGPDGKNDISGLVESRQHDYGVRSQGDDWVLVAPVND